MKQDRPAVFIDRDGVLNKNVYYPCSGEWEAPRCVDDFEFIDGALEALQSLHQARYLLFVVTNQPSFAKGKTSREALEAILQRFRAQLDDYAIPIAHLYCCFHHPQAIVESLALDCPYRKPHFQAIEDACQRHHLDRASCWMIGDRDTDVACGVGAGVQTIQVSPDYSAAHPTNPQATHCVGSFVEAVAIVA